MHIAFPWGRQLGGGQGAQSKERAHDRGGLKSQVGSKNSCLLLVACCLLRSRRPWPLALGAVFAQQQITNKNGPRPSQEGKKQGGKSKPKSKSWCALGTGASPWWLVVLGPLPLIPFEQKEPDYLLWGCFRSRFASSSTPAGCLLQLMSGLRRGRKRLPCQLPP
jgi:hypothetical protein